MSWHGKRLPNFVKAPTEIKLRDELGKITIGLGEKLEIITIYSRGSFVYAWYFLDISKADRIPKTEAQLSKKKVSKKTKAK